MSRLFIVSNRVPSLADGSPAAGGLAVSLAGLIERQGGLWFGWSGKVSDCAATCSPVINRQADVQYATIDLTQAEHDGYYNNFSNGALWPALHGMPELMTCTQTDRQIYQAVNRRFVQALAPLLRPTDVIWVHDYHLMALPRLLRAHGICNPIGFFLHVPFAPSEITSLPPSMLSLARDLLSADLVGFQTDQDRDNFTAIARRIAGATVRRDGAIACGDTCTQLGVFPVEIDPIAFATAADAAVGGVDCQRLRDSLNGQSLVLGIDRLDPTKGLIQKLAGFRLMLEQHPHRHRCTTLLQIAALSRQEVGAYRDLHQALTQVAGALNAAMAYPDWSPLRLVSKTGDRAILAGYMRMAQVGLVTPLRDGMNLVAKEYVAAQDPADPGVLVLSRFAGAAHELVGALVVDPAEAQQVADALEKALCMTLTERQGRWNAMWSVLQQTSPLRWGTSFLSILGGIAVNTSLAEDKAGMGCGAETLRDLPVDANAGLHWVQG